VKLYYHAHIIYIAAHTAEDVLFKINIYISFFLNVGLLVGASARTLDIHPYLCLPDSCEGMNLFLRWGHL
jgi:hypothetical protein